MKILSTLVFTALLLSPVSALGTPAIEASQTAQVASEDILIVTSSKAAVRTLADKNGPSVMQPVMGQVLRIQGKQKAAFLPVVAPGGFAVWIFGRNLKTTDVEGVLEVTANAINQRPRPSSSISSYPLKEKLHSGDRVRVISRADDSKPLAEDWVEVWSSASTVGWILASDCRPVKAGGSKMWADAMTELGGHAARKRGDAQPAVMPKQPKPAGVDQAAKAVVLLDRIDGEVVAARGMSAPDLSAQRKAYRQVVEAKINATLTARAQAGLELIEVVELAKGLESDLETVKQRRVEDVLARQKEEWTKGRRRDPLAGRFDARGVLERRSVAGQAHSYVLRWGPELVCEVRSGSGRYDLDLFAGYELGLKGVLDYVDEGALLKERPVLTVGRIEVLSKR